MPILLNEKFHTPFETIPFNQVKIPEFLPALKEAIQSSKAKIAQLKKNSDRPTFKNVLESMEDATRQVDIVASVFFNLHSAENNPELQAVAKDFSPLLSEFQNDILLDHELFQKIEAVYQTRSSFSLAVEESTLLENKYKAFVRNGAKLSPEQKNELREIDQRMSKLTLEFSDHLLEETKNYVLWVDQVSDLLGLPENFIEAAALCAKEKGRPGSYAFTLQQPSFVPFLTFVEKGALREELYKAFASRGFRGDANDNRKVMQEIATLRFKRARLLGYKAHADFILEERMAQSAERVRSFLKEVYDFALPAAKKELDQLQKFAKKNGHPGELKKWDVGFWSERLKKELYSIDDELLRPYFKLENCIDGVFKVASKLYGLSFKENKAIQVYHPEVKVYTVEKEGHFTAVLYADFFPRDGKQSGAWMTSYRGQRNFSGHEQRPHISIVCNFTKSSPTRPSLLNLTEGTTLFHEFGHALHGMLANTKYESLSGTNVFWDFVELPSQILENWVYEKECLDLFAAHYETGEKIPGDLVKRIRESSNFQEGMATLRQLSFASLDMDWHSGDPSGISDLEQFEQKSMGPYQLLEHVPGTNASCAFSHIFSGGYSAGYYSYKWAEVLDADAFEYFKENGIFNPTVARKFYDHVLSKGGSEAPQVLYRRFRGQEPTPKALFKRAGLIS